MLSIVIPTLQKNTTILSLLIDTLTKDQNVGEIILIDNSLKGFQNNSPKLRVIVPEQNLYVNPSWNLGVQEAKYDFIGLLNDDIAVAENFCSNVLAKLDEKNGIYGVNIKNVVSKDEISEIPQNTSGIEIEKINYRGEWFGVAMFFHKNSYVKIPEQLKIYRGDDWIVLQAKKNKKQNYTILGQDIYHLGSLSSADKNFNPILRQDAKNYTHLTVKWYNRLFSTGESINYYCLRLCGITFNLKKSFLNEIKSIFKK